MEEKRWQQQHQPHLLKVIWVEQKLSFCKDGTTLLRLYTVIEWMKRDFQTLMSMVRKYWSIIIAIANEYYWFLCVCVSHCVSVGKTKNVHVFTTWIQCAILFKLYSLSLSFNKLAINFAGCVCL